MSSLGQWAFSLCATVTVCSVVMLLSPSKRLEKSLRLGCVLLFVICLCAPLRKLSVPQLTQGTTVSSASLPTPQQSLCSGLELLIESLLQQNGITAQNVTVTFQPDGTLHAILAISDRTQQRPAVLLVESTYQIHTTVTEE